MSHPARVFSLLAVAALAVAGLTACDPGLKDDPIPVKTGDPTSAPTSNRSPTPDAPVASKVQIDGTSVSVLAADGTVVVAIPFTTDGITAANQFAEAIGSRAAIHVDDANSCRVVTTHYEWGGIDFVVPGGYAEAPGATFVAVSRGATTNTGLAVTMPSGQGVGSSIDEAVAANPGASHEGDATSNVVLYYDALSGTAGSDMDSFYGAAAYTQGNVITSLVSPIYYYYDC